MMNRREERERVATLAEANGYQYEFSPKIGHTFNKGHRYVWAIFDGWQTADMVEGFYRNHLRYPQEELEAALGRDLRGYGE
jgi:hypothetical protein